MPAPRNLVSLKDVAKSYGSRAVLREITLGVSSGERIGIVGRNGDGKSTLLRLIAGDETPDSGALVRSGELQSALLPQREELAPGETIREALIGARADHEWAGSPVFRGVLDGLLGGVELRFFAAGLGTAIEGLPEASASASRSRACCSTRRSCCCWTSPRTTSMWKASIGSRDTSPHAAARCWS